MDMSRHWGYEILGQEKQVNVKIPIFVAFSNAMNPWEIIPVPSLRRDAVPGLHARSRSASLGLPQSGQTWIISRPDYAGLQGLTIVLWPKLHVSTVRRPSLQAFAAGRQTRTIHLTFWLVWSQPSKTSSKITQVTLVICITKVPRSPKPPRYPGLFSLPGY